MTLLVYSKPLVAGTPLCECGCGTHVALAQRNHTKNGYVKGEPMRFARGHQWRNRVIKPLRYVVEDCGHTTSCWVWQLQKSRGYGRMTKDGEMVAAHRFCYERYKGPIPQGLTLDHLCRNRACVNPDHLEPVTLGENLRRGLNTRLDPDNVREIRGLVGAGWRQGDIANAYGIAKSYVSDLASYVTWKDVA